MSRWKRQADADADSDSSSLSSSGTTELDMDTDVDATRSSSRLRKGLSGDSTEASTPATSVMGDGSKSDSKPSTITTSKYFPTRLRTQSKTESNDTIEEGSSSSELSDMEEVDVHNSAPPGSQRSPSDTEGINRRINGLTRSASASSAVSLKRRPSPEVVIYVKHPSSSASRQSMDKGKKRARSDIDEEEDELDEGKVDVKPKKGRNSAADSSMSAGGFLTAKQLKALKDKEMAVKKEIDLDSDTSDSDFSVPIPTKAKGKGRAVSPDPKKEAAMTRVAKSARATLAKVRAGTSRASSASSTKRVTKKVDVKGKGRKIDTDSEDELESEFEVDSELEESESSAVETPADSDSDLSDVEEEIGSVEAVVAKIKRSSKRNQKKPSRKGLTWWEKNDLDMREHHPELTDVWGDLAQLPVITPQKQEQPPGLSLKLLPFQQEGLYWMLQQEKGPWKGGMLADEMGMGKTIQTISLILSDHDPNHKKHTLILAPTVAIMQWRNEFQKFTDCMKVCVWHGGNRTNDMKELLKFDVVLTSYAVLESAFRKQNTGFKRKGELVKEDSVLHAIEWHRVILDEAHNIKDRSCNTARGAFALKAEYKWCLSGTPLQNRVGELYSLIRFIGVEPFAFYFCKKCPCKSLHWRFSNKRHCDDCGHTPMHHICYWNNEILKPIQKYGATAEGHGSGAFKKLTLLLQRMMLRRTKVERADDMGLPPRDIKVRRDFFTEEEEEFYSSLYTDVKRQFSTYVAADSLLNNYANVFQLLTRMRQTACHPDLVLKGRTAKALLGDVANADLSISTCRICLDEGEDPIMSKCKHVFCRDCMRQYLETSTEWEPECPVCHIPITIDLNQEASEELLQARQGMLEKIDPGKWRTSTKIEALVEELSKLKTEDSSIKSLVFSQFTSFLDLIARRLQLAGFKIARLQGNMTPEARDRTVKYFMNTTDCTVFLLSLKAGGVALNLTEASRVFIMDPWWNPAAELQGMDRIHRIGQHRPVIVKRLIIENSIESKIVELQKKKSEMIGATLGDDDQALGRLTPEDLAFLFVM